ncbi:MAG: hemolysin family protein [Syntrophomonadaceae bacterium]|nr:hemolysin family protein [Syntrophomonadaceae bacterium]
MESQLWIDILQIVAALLLVALNAFFVAAEFAFVRARPTHIEQLAQEGNRVAGLAREGIIHLDAYLSVCQLGITLASLGLGWLGEPAIAGLLEPMLLKWGIVSPVAVHSIAIAVAFLLITFMHVVFGELAPKTLAIQRAERMVLWLAVPMRGFYYLFYPAVVALNGTAQLILKPFGINDMSESELTHTEEELSMLIRQSWRGGHIDAQEQELLQNVFRFERLVARDIMVPRPETVFFYLENSFEENMELAQKTGHTRFPVCDDSPDKIVGLLHIKDMMYGLRDQEHRWQHYIRDIVFVPEGMGLDDLLEILKESHQHMAVVMDEYGGTAGIVTLENLMEELVGDIYDEFDPSEPLDSDGEGRLLSGRMLIGEVEKMLDIDLVEGEDEYDTLGGYALGCLAHRPKVGETIDIAGGYRLEVQKVRGTRIDLLRLHNPGENKVAE